GHRHPFSTLFQEAFVLNLSISRRSRTAGFTFIEMLLVFVIMGLMLSITVKSVRGTWVASSRRSASREVTSYLFRARAIAIQQSRTAWLVRSGNVLKIMVDSSGTPVRLGTQIDMSARYGATLGAPSAARAAGSAAAVSRGISEAWTLDHLARADDVTVNVTFLSNRRQRTETFRSFLPC